MRLHPLGLGGGVVVRHDVVTPRPAVGSYVIPRRRATLRVLVALPGVMVIRMIVACVQLHRFL